MIEAGLCQWLSTELAEDDGDLTRGTYGVGPARLCAGDRGVEGADGSGLGVAIPLPAKHCGERSGTGLAVPCRVEDDEERERLM